jgi:hypothetical protein
MNTKISVVFMLAAIVGLVLALGADLAGCAHVFDQVHDEVDVAGPTAVVTGPARGHWQEEGEHALLSYTVFGTDCTAMPYAIPELRTEGWFALGPGVTLCVMSTTDKVQRISYHAETL